MNDNKLTINKKNIDKIKGLIQANNGYITSKLVTDLGIHRMFLKIMLERNEIKKVATGVYIDPEKSKDEFFVFSISTPSAMFSHMTSLYLLGFTNKKPEKFDITVSNNYFNYRLKEYNMYFVSPSLLKMGITKVKTPKGNRVNVYDLERSICDIIRCRKRLDIDEVKKIVNKYKSSEQYNLEKLLEYSDRLNVRNEIEKFMDLK